MNIIKTFFYILFFSMSCFGQDIFQYEKKIQNIENYNATDLEFFNSKEKIKLYGILIAPKNHYDKIIIVVPGSGMDTRNNHYQLTENLLQNNIAVFRYDERGVGKSEGKFSTANYTITDMANDLRIIYDSL